MFKRTLTAREPFGVLVLVAIAGLIGVWCIANTQLITKDGVFWIQAAQKGPLAETTLNNSGATGQRYAFSGVCKDDSKQVAHISVGVNGISVYGLGRREMPALAVHRGSLDADWNHIAVVFSDRRPHIFLNGQLVRTGRVGGLKSITAPTQMGASKYGLFRGTIRDVRIWNRALSEREIPAVMNRDAAGSGLILHLRLDEKEGDIAFDSSGSDHHAAITGAKRVVCQGRRAIRLDEPQDKVAFGYVPPEDNFTVSAWVRAVESHAVDLEIATRDAGYPAMLFYWHGLLSRFGFGNSNLDWVLAGQSLCLIFRMLSLIPLYCIGRHMVGGRHASWALLILIFLPWPAEWGHDVLREWPGLLFFSGGLLMVLWAFSCGCPLLLLPAGLLAGIGHTIRSECAQIVLLGLFGSILAFRNPAAFMPRKKTIAGTVFLLLGFGIVFLPYARFRGRYLPIRIEQLFADNTAAVEPVEQRVVCPVADTQEAGLFKPIAAVMELIQQLSENLYYFFFPFMAVGLYYFFRRPHGRSFDRWLVASAIVINLLICMVLYLRWQTIGRRHVLPLTALVVFFVPLGLEAVAAFCAGKKEDLGAAVAAKRQKCVFLLLIAAGILICLPKLAEPKGSNVGLRKTAEYLRLNTPPDAIIAVPDARITFYAERRGMIYKDEAMEGVWDYLVVIKNGDEPCPSEPLTSSLTKVYYHPLRLDRCSGHVVTYRRTREPQEGGVVFSPARHLEQGGNGIEHDVNVQAK